MRRYLEALLALSSVERVQAVVEDPSLLDYVGALLAELEQAEKDRDEATVGAMKGNSLAASIASWERSVITDGDLANTEALLARLAKVPALVEALERITLLRDSPTVPALDEGAFAREIARAALAAWEAE